MARIAYLTGESGSGKTEASYILGRRLKFDLIVGDHVLSATAARMRPPVRRRHNMQTGLWLALMEHCYLHSLFHEVILDLYPELPESRLPILAEATLFALEPLHRQFHAAVRRARPDVAEAKLFWLDVSAETLVRQVEKRNRDGDKLDIPEAERRLAFLGSHLGPREATRAIDALGAVYHIQKYLED